MRSELSVEDIKWALLIVGIGLILWGIHDFNYANQEPVNIADTGKQNIHAGMVIEGDLPCNYGIFAQATVYGNDAPDKVKYYYLIPVGDGSYMGYLSTASDENCAKFYPHSRICPPYGFFDQDKDAESYALSRNSGR